MDDKCKCMVGDILILEEHPMHKWRVTKIDRSREYFDAMMTKPDGTIHHQHSHRWGSHKWIIDGDQTVMDDTRDYLKALEEFS